MENHLDFPDGRWRGQWIWADDAPDGRHVVALRRAFSLDAVPPCAPARWHAVSLATVWVNGVEVGRGPVRANPRHQFWDELDLAARLRTGRNEIAALAVCYGGPTPWHLPGPRRASDLVGGAFVFEAQLDAERWIVSDESWSAAVLDGWTTERGQGSGISGRGCERIAAASLPATWYEDEMPWPTARRRRAMATGEAGVTSRPPSYPYGPFARRPIAFGGRDDVRLREVEPGRFVAPRVSVGTLEVDAEGSLGAELLLRVTEQVDDAGGPLRSDHDTFARLVLDGERRTVETLDLYGGQGVVVEASHGARVHAVTIRERCQPVSGDASFACSDPLLEAVWAVGRRSVTINSTDAYTDCPTREQRAWTGDSVVHQLVDLTTNADWRMPRWHPRLAAVPRADGMLPMAVAGDIEATDFTIIPDWALHWVHSVWNLYRYVGDREEVGRLLSVAEGVLRWFGPFIDHDGLLRDVVGWVIIDWASVCTRGRCTALNGLFGRALVEFADMAEWLGDAGRAAWARSRHARLRAGFEQLWDEGRGRYRDSSEFETASQHAQAAAIVGDLAPRERWPRLTELLLDRSNRVHATFSVPDGPAPPNSESPLGGVYLVAGHPTPWWDVDDLVAAQPFFRYVVHDALVTAGRHEAIADACRDWASALERCSTSLTETWFGGTLSHGWGATPTRDMMQVVLGVTPETPGFETARIEPALGDLGFARGRVVHPKGSIAVAAEGSRLTVESPVGFVTDGRHYAAGAHQIERRG